MRLARRIAAGLVIAGLVAGLCALGAWQLHRRSWKLALIAQVEQRLAASPVPAPGPAAWPRVGTDAAYTRVAARGHFLPVHETLVQAVTSLGAGYWVLQPLADERGFTLLVNRGFVPFERASPTAHAAPPSGQTRVEGLLRLTEPKGGFLRSNAPAADRWYSRDVAAIARRRGVGPVAPYFIDAGPKTGTAWPRGGLTVVAFANSHLSYALTWFTLAAGLAGASLWLAFGKRAP